MAFEFLFWSTGFIENIKNSTKTKLCDITKCEQCSHVWKPTATMDPQCFLNKFKSRYNNDVMIPEWCPLENAPKNYSKDRCV